MNRVTKAGLAVLAAGGLSTTLFLTSAGATAHDSGRQGCSSGWSVDTFTRTTSTESHFHQHISDTGTKRQHSSPTPVSQFGRNYGFRVADWYVETPGYFSYVRAACQPNPLSNDT